MLRKQKEAEAQMAGAMVQYDTLDKAGVLYPEEKTKFATGNANQRHAIVVGATPRLLNKFQDAQLAHENQQTELLKQQIAASQDAMKPSPYANTPIWMADPTTGERVQVGEHDDKGTPHYLPYGNLNRGGQPFTPDEATTKAMQDSGYTYAPTSNKAGRWIDTTGNKPNLDEQGNPMFTPDGTAFISGRKLVPLTQPMQSQRMIYRSQNPSPTPTPAPPASVTVSGPVPVKSQADYDALPDGVLYTAPDGSQRRKQRGQ